MSLLTRKRTLLAKTETTYGVDSVPTGSANAMLVKNLNINPIQAELVSRDLIRPYLGNSEQLLATTFVQVDFEVEYVASGVVGKTPAYDALLKACGFASTQQTLAISNLEQTANVATATVTGHGKAVGDRVIIQGAVPSAYNGEVTILSVPNANTFTYAVTGSPASPATGSPVMVNSRTYSPISEGFESATIYYNVDGVLHKLTGCFGTVELSLAVRQIPVFRFQFTGLYNDPTDTAAPAVDFSAFMIPQIANTQNTPGFSLFGYSGAMESMSLNVSNTVEYITLIGRESVKILDRAPQGTLVFEATTMAEKDFFTSVKNSETGVMTIAHGSRNGFKIGFNAPRILLGNPTYQDSNGVQMLSAPFTLNPISGNDEFTLSFT